MALLSGARPVAGQEATEAVAERRATLARERSETERALASAQDAALRAHLGEVRERQQALDSLLRRQEELAVTTEPAAPEAPEELAPSAFALHRLYEAQFDAEQRRARLAEALAASRTALESAREKLEEADRKRREVRGKLEAADGVLEKTRAERALQLRQLESREASERVQLRTLETQLAEQRLELAEADQVLAERIARMRAALASGAGGPGAGFASLAAAEGEIRQTRRAAERELASTELRLDAAKLRFSRQADPPAGVLEEVEALGAKRDALRQELALADARLERLSAQRATWHQWDTLLRGEGRPEDFEPWKEAAGERLAALEQAELERGGQRADLEGRLEALDRRLLALPAGAGVRRTLEEQRATLVRLLDAERAEAAGLESDRRLSARLLAELRERTGELDLLAYGARGLRGVRDAWGYEVTAVDDSPITVGSLVLALLLAAAGLWASRRGSAWVGRLAQGRFGLDPGAVYALETLGFYILLVSFTLLALRAVHFPLTAFTVLGGALAIGIGFGSQNVMNNFISGLILMIERPVRAGDVVEVDGNHGSIEQIGARSTQIRSVDGRHIVVPNSFFLESNVVNWTLSDDLVRTSVVVGVIYGSPTRLVEELIRRSVDEEERVLKRPEPIIIFDEFGDNSLNFVVHFWVRARSPMDMRKVQSRLRFKIDDLFREHGLVIAFPQRDVHLDSAAPIEVRVLNETDHD